MRVIVAALPLLIAACGHEARGAPVVDATRAEGSSVDLVERGRYLATAADCGACHSAADGPPYAGGKAIPTPFGTVLASNLTPDRNTGIGAWSDEEFVNAVQRGLRKDGKHLYPAMPYPYYTRMTRADVLATRAYLATLAPVAHEVKSDQLSFPFRIRGLMGVWNSLYFSPGMFQPRSTESAEWNRGAYLVEAPGHCAACHTPKGLLGGDKKDATLAGGILDGWVTPNLRRDPRTGLASWSAEDVAAYLKAGSNSHASASGPMAEVIEKSTSQLTDTDLRAISLYLTTLTGSREAAPVKVAHDGPVWRSGKQLYLEACAPCHESSGEGVARLFPPLKGSSIVQSMEPSTLVRVVLHGTQNAATERAPTGPSMPAFGWKLTDAEIAAVLTYVRNAWGNAGSPVSAGKVQAARNVRGDAHSAGAARRARE